MTILVVDVGTTTVRVGAVDERLDIVAMRRWTSPPDTPFPGMVEFDAARLARDVVAAATAVVDEVGGVSAVGIATQRASTVLWNRRTGAPLGPALGWQDLRTVGDCIAANDSHGLHLAPNQTATKVAWLVANHATGVDVADLAVGTLDSWLAWTLTGGAVHVTDHTNAAVTGLTTGDAAAWDPATADIVGVDATMLPTIVPSASILAAASVLPGAPPIAAIVGDQQSSLVGQGCVVPGRAKVTFGTGGMLDVCTGSTPPITPERGEHGSFPIVTWSTAAGSMWGREAIMLSAGSAVEWLSDDLGVVADPRATAAAAAAVDDSDGVWFVPALLGMATPQWDFGARGSLFGLTRGTTAGHLVRAVLDGIAHRGVDLIEAAEADSDVAVDAVRVDGGMSTNPLFVQLFADLAGRAIEVSPVPEATTRGAAVLAGVATGQWSDVAAADDLWVPSAVVEPSSAGDANRDELRNRWRQAVERSIGWIPELSALDF